MKLRKNNKKGFTIVELVIVIAVIGILTAILVPVFINLTNKANEASDQSLVKNLNTAMSMEEGEGKKNNTYHDAIEYLDDYGYKLANLATKAENDLLWNSKSNRFLLNEASAFSKDQAETGAADYEYWTIKDSIPNGNKFSIYAGRGWDEVSAVAVDGVGFDAGYHTLSSVAYTNSSNDTRKVTIRTTGGTLTVGASGEGNEATGSIYHYGTLDEAIVYTTNNSFHTHGKIASMDLKKGLAVAEDRGYVALIKAAAGTEIEEKDTGVFYIPSTITTADVDADVAATLGYNVTAGGTTADEARTAKINSTVYQIDNKFDLIAFRDSVNAGNTFAGITVKLNSDIDLEGVDWTPIGLYKGLDGESSVRCKFSGTFDGQNHTIDNMHIIALSSVNTFKSSYRALFGFTNGVIENFTVKGSIVGTDCAGVVAALDNGGQILNVNSYVTLTGQTGKKGGEIPEHQDNIQGKVAGICVTVKPDDAGCTWRIENCNNYGNVSSAGSDGAGGIVAWTNRTDSNLTTNGLFIKNCHNYGSITSTGTAPVGGISGHACKIHIENCVNEGSINGSKAGGIFGDFGVYNNSYGGIINNCENKGTISGGQTGGIGYYAYDVRFSQLKNSGTINGTSAKGEIFAQLDYTNVDANEFTFTKSISAIGVFNPVATNGTRYIANADDYTVGVIKYKIDPNVNSTVQIRNSTITTLNVNPIDNHSATLVLDNSNIGTINLNKNVTGMSYGFTMYIQEKVDTTNSLGNVNLYGTLKNGWGGNVSRFYFGIACTFTRTSEASSDYILDMHANEGYSISGPTSNVWTITKNS